MPIDKTREDGDGYVRLFAGRHMDFIVGASWLKNCARKKRDHRMLLVKNSNTRQIGVRNHRQGEIQNLGTKRGLPLELNRNSGWVKRMFASIFAPETVAGYRIVQNSDAEFPGDETDDEDDLPYLDLSEVYKVQASSSYPSVDTGKIDMPLTSPNPKPTTRPHGIPRRALSSVFAGPPKSSFLKDIKFRKKPSSSTTANAVAQYADLWKLLRIPLHVVCVLPVSFGANLFLRTNLDPVMVLLIVIGSVLAKKLFSTRTS
ncbi:hypothetical protein C8J55DRAFT_490332 [Lentinula edodes]|uniref:Uncharacterized protein n=1 Tax=Lentinula lateritia TaxID=40482 RepID=A0A9W9DMI5_9AGAR|nr:hypothetical protein C8J55DRAFT_490332 [Lentinula edodes]